jgi:hypothetical protein
MRWLRVLATILYSVTAPPGKDFAGYIEATVRREGSKARQ